jgi:Prenyltransferase and squalene oxidase repeat
MPDETFRNACLSKLQSLQNPDGGWGFHANEPSRVEPSCWAISALFDSNHSDVSDSYRKTTNFLRTAQLADGSWPASPQMITGSWITSLACSVLRGDAESANNVKAGLNWICEDFPRDSSRWQRMLQSLRPKSNLVSQNDSYRGWGWTPHTASWVEPTSFALLALREADPRHLPKNATERRDLAISLLYDRMCPGGGWNCGNPRVYGVDGDALVLPTCWALLALSPATSKKGTPENDAQEKPGRTLSLAWLQKEFTKIQSPGSLAVASMTLQHYGIELPPSSSESQHKRDLRHWSAEDLSEQGTHVLAWACMALDPARQWPAPIRKASDRAAAIPHAPVPDASDRPASAAHKTFQGSGQ